MKKLLLTLLVLFILQGQANAITEDGPLQLNFEQAVKKALEKNQKLNAFKYKVNGQERFISVQRGDFLPSVNFNQGFVWTNNPAEVFGLKLNKGELTGADFAAAPGSFNNPGDQTNFLSEITLEQSLFNKRNFHKLKIAKNQYEAGQNEYERIKEKVVIEVARAYLNVINAENYVQVAKKSIDAAKEHNRIANVRYENELGLYSDVLRTNTFLKKAEQRLVSAQKNYEVAKKVLGLAIGVNNSVETETTVPEFEVSEAKLLNRADIKAMQTSYENAKNRIGLQRALYYPELKAGGNYRVYSFEADSFSLYGQLGWNLFNGLKKPHLVKIAEYELKQAEEMLEELKLRAEYEVFDAKRSVEEKRKNLELSKAALASAEEGMKLVEVRYKNSLSPIIDILDAQLNLDQARADVISSRNEYLFSLINLAFAGGTILDELGLNGQEL